MSEAMITVRSCIQSPSGDNETIEQRAQASLAVVGGMTRISYETREGDSRCDNDIIFRESEPLRLRIRREGAMCSDMLFEEGAEHCFEYSALGYKIDARVMTEELSVTRNEGGIDIGLKYILNLGSDQTHTSVSITVTEL